MCSIEFTVLLISQMLTLSDRVAEMVLVRYGEGLVGFSGLYTGKISLNKKT